MRLLKPAVVVCTLLVMLALRAQVYAQGSCTITDINLDGKNVPADCWSAVAVDPQSVLRVSYNLKSSSDSSPFRYVLRLRSGDQESTITNDMSSTSKTYSGLPRGFYAFEVGAQGLDSTWTSSVATLDFVSDKNQAKLFKKMIEMAQAPPATESSSVPVLVYILSALLAAALIAIVVLARKSAVKKPTAIEQILAKPPVTEEEKRAEDERREQQAREAKVLQMLKEEVVQVRKENDQLQSMVQDLSRKTQELNSQNKELEVQVDRVSKVKSELESLQQQKDDVFAVIVHDIKNPASLIKNLVDLLRSYDLNSNETHEVLQDIVDTTTRIVSMSQELSRVMAMDQVEIQVSRHDVDVCSLVQSVTRRNNSAAQKKGIHIECAVPATAVHSELDNEKIEEVVDNLLSNAIKFSLPGTTVTISVQTGPDFFSIDVTDQGIGMSKEDIQNAFQRGVRLSARPTADEPSSGLGLWIVKRLVEAHDGSVTVQSEVGIGTTFTVMLPYGNPSAKMAS